MADTTKETRNTNSEIRQIIAAVIVNLMALSSGMSIGWTSTAMPHLVEPQSPFPLTADEASWITSLLFLAASVSTPFAGLLPDRIGRKNTGYITAASMTICWILISVANSSIYLYVARIFSGITTVLSFIFAPMYVVEISADNIRGSLGTIVSVLCNVGIALSYILGSFLAYEVVCYINICIPILFVCLFFWLPETPRYLLKTGKFEEAERSLWWFRGIGYDAKTEVSQIRSSLEREECPSYKEYITRLHSSKAAKRGLILVVVLAVNLQLSGIQPVISYTVLIFRESGSNISPNLSTIIVGFLLVAGNVSSTFLVERVGRKMLLIISNIGMIISLIALGTYFYLKHFESDVSKIEWLPVTSLSIYVMAISVGVSPMFYIVLNEIISPSLRYLANTLCITLLWFLGFVGAKCFHNLAETIKFHNTFWVFSVCCFLAMLVIIFQLPETKGKSLDEISRELEGKVRKQEKMYDLQNI